jgi:hypothetical protein
LADSLLEAAKKGPTNGTDPRTIYLETNIYRKLFSVYTSGRLLCKLYDVGEYRGASLITLMYPIARPGWFSQEPINCMCPDIQLLYLFQLAYRPYAADFQPILYGELFTLIKKVYSLLITDVLNIKDYPGAGGQINTPGMRAVNALRSKSKEGGKRPGQGKRPGPSQDDVKEINKAFINSVIKGNRA